MVNSRHLVFYGAGRNAALEIDERSQTGAPLPLCFCDSDFSKQGTTYLGLPVMSLEQAREKYGDFDIFITPYIKGEIFRYLIEQGIPQEKIVNFTVDMESYKSCIMLESHLAIDYHPRQYIFHFCCQMNEKMNFMPYYKCHECTPLEEAIGGWVILRNEIISALKAGVSSKCDGCANLVDTWFQTEKKIKMVHFCFAAPCQLKCIYCSSVISTREARERFVTDFDYAELVAQLEKRNLLCDETTFNFAAGELSINPQKNDILRSISKYRTMIDTNALVFDEKIAKLASRPGSRLNISIDAGTGNTYKTVKGVDAYEKVWSNIKKYVDHGVKVEIKYIVLSQNCGDSDVRGFMEKLMKIKESVSCLLISTVYLEARPLSSDILNCASKMVRLAKQNGIVTSFTDYFTADEKKLIVEIAERG